MEKYAEIKMNAFYNELEKLGGLWTALGKGAFKLTTKYIPKLLKATGKAVTGKAAKGVGALEQAGNFLGRTAKGGQSVHAGKTVGKIMGEGIERAAKTHGPHATGIMPKVDLKNMVTERAFGKKKFLKNDMWKTLQRPSTASMGTPKYTTRLTKHPITWTKEHGKKMMGEVATGMNTINQKKLPYYFKNQARRAQIRPGKADPTRMYKRSPLGRASGLASDTALGMGASFFALDTALGGAKDENGNKKSLIGRVGGSLASGAAWAFAPVTMGTGLMAGMAGNAAVGATKKLKKKKKQEEIT